MMVLTTSNAVLKQKVDHMLQEVFEFSSKTWAIFPNLFTNQLLAESIDNWLQFFVGEN